jgi:hypothetical protein
MIKYAKLTVSLFLLQKSKSHFLSIGRQRVKHPSSTCLKSLEQMKPHGYTRRKGFSFPCGTSETICCIWCLIRRRCERWGWTPDLQHPVGLKIADRLHLPFVVFQVQSPHWLSDLFNQNYAAVCITLTRMYRSLSVMEEPSCSKIVLSHLYIS